MAPIAQWHRDRRAARPKTAKLVSNQRLREYVQDRLATDRDTGQPPGGRDQVGVAGRKADKPFKSGGERRQRLEPARRFLAAEAGNEASNRASGLVGSRLIRLRAITRHHHSSAAIRWTAGRAV